MNTLNKTEEEKMLEALEKLARSHGTGGWQTLEDMVKFGQAAIAHANTQHSKLLEDYDRIARVAEKQAQQIAMLRNNIHHGNGCAKVRYSYDYECNCGVDSILNNTQAAADAFLAEHSIKSAAQFKELLLESTKVFVHPHIEGVFGVFEERLRASANRKDE